jgi:tetratricopeptide (TPR) repeat protein
MDTKIIKIASLLICFSLVGCNSVKPNDGSAPITKKASPVIELDPSSRANQLISEGKFSEAIKILEPYVGTMPANWRARVETSNKISVYYWDQEHLTQCIAIEALNNKKVDALLDASYSRAYYLIAYAYLELKDVKKADTNLDRALALEPDSPVLLAEKGTLNQISGRPDLAVAFFQKAIDSKACKLDKELGKSYRGLGVSLIDLEKLNEAEQALYTSLKYSPNNQTAIGELNYIDKLRGGKPKQPISPDLIKTK